MSGPSWLIGKAIKVGLTACGADPITSTVVARGFHIASSTIFHDHHTHFHPYGDEIDDVSSIADQLRDGAEAISRLDFLQAHPIDSSVSFLIDGQDYTGTVVDFDQTHQLVKIHYTNSGYEGGYDWLDVNKMTS